MKVCDICDKEFELPTTFKHSAHLRKNCYSCIPDDLSTQEKVKLRIKLHLQKTREHKESIGCYLCGYNKFGVALDWHHPNNDKDMNPSSLLTRGGFKAYLEETKKCILLCACCHRAVHSGDLKV